VASMREIVVGGGSFVIEGM